MYISKRRGNTLMSVQNVTPVGRWKGGGSPDVEDFWSFLIK
jgi:hypothetical protein